MFNRSQCEVFFLRKARKAGLGYLIELKSVFFFNSEKIKKKKITRFKIRLWVNANTVSGLSRRFFV